MKELKVESIIAKYLGGELTLEEQHELSKWLESDVKNAKILNQLHAYWHYHKDDLREEEQEVRARLNKMINAEMINKPSVDDSSLWKNIIKVAASIVIVFSFALVTHHYTSDLRRENEQISARLIEKVSLPGQKITTVLPDGTIVKLNADSKLIVPEPFDKDIREVKLVGEAFFDVKRNPERPFVIKTDGITVRVLGTSFNVSAYNESTLSVAVKTGKVAVTNDYNQTVKLDKDQMTYLDGMNLVNGSISESNNPFAWTSQQLAFNDETFDQVSRKISRWYGIEIYNMAVVPKDKTFTAKYDDPTIKEVMETLSFVYLFKYNYDEKAKRINIK